MSDHDLRRQVREIRTALQRFDREQLIEILTHLFGTYVLEGGAGDAAPLPGLKAGDFEGLGFAEVVERLQLRLNLPELRLLEVQGGQVSVRVEGRLVPLRAAAPEPVVPAPPPAASAERQALRQRLSEVLTAPASPAPPGRSAREELDSLMRPSSSTDGRSVTARGGVPTRPAPAAPPTPAPAAPAAAAPAAPAAPAAAAPAAAAPARPAEKPEEPGSRFSLLEID